MPAAGRQRERVFTWANLVTALRTVSCLLVFAIAARRHSAAWNLAGLALYWGLDILDGYLARRLDQETRLGAQFDILADRLLVACFYMNHAAWHHADIVPVALFLFQFILIDQYLSNQFLRWNIASPNYFHLIDPIIWRLNWSPLAKAGNTGLVTVLLVAFHAPRAAVLASALLIVVKIYSLVRMLRLRSPELDWATPPGC
jgi:CDP-diacylglycerol--glycerol-3-phosphate 3-phosphatidyltransferase